MEQEEKGYFEYGFQYWSRNNFIVEDGVIKVNRASKPSLLEIVQKAKEFGIETPILIRFPHLIDRQMNKIYTTFQKAIEKEKYQGRFQAVFPLKVNQYSGFLNEFLRYAPKYGYGLEAGSKAELLLAISMNSHKAPITVNGFKDREMIELGFLATQMGHNVTLIIESLSELKDIITISKRFPKIPNIGIRIRLYSYGSGTWAKSGGIDSKFGLTATEIIQALRLLKQENYITFFKMLHFHIGSQIASIYTVQKALREAGQIYGELKKMGAKYLNKINIGGGLGVDYGQHKSRIDRNYTTEEFASTVVKIIKEVTDEKGIENPSIYAEFGRFVSANHAVLITSVLELYTQDYRENHLFLKERNNPQVIRILKEIYKKVDSQLDEDEILELLHETIQHVDSIETLFRLGYLDLQDRANIEILGQMIIKKILSILDKNELVEHDSLLHKIEERYLINFSIFQSIPDFWGLGQTFPIIPIHHLDKKAVRPASIWDITCDSDGEIEFDEKAPLFLHDIDLTTKPYYIGFFMVGAYQDTLGMRHNLFDRPSEIIVDVDEVGFSIRDSKVSKSLTDILSEIGYSYDEIYNKLREQINNISPLSSQDRDSIFRSIEKYFHMDNYLNRDEIWG